MPPATTTQRPKAEIKSGSSEGLKEYNTAERADSCKQGREGTGERPPGFIVRHLLLTLGREFGTNRYSSLGVQISLSRSLPVKREKYLNEVARC